MNISSLLPSNSGNKLSTGPENTSTTPTEGFEFASLLSGQIKGSSPGTGPDALENTATSASTPTLLSALLTGQTPDDSEAALHLILPDETVSTKLKALLQANENSRSSGLTATKPSPNEDQNTRIQAMGKERLDQPLAASDQDTLLVAAEKMLATLKSNRRQGDATEGAAAQNPAATETAPFPILRPISDATSSKQAATFTPSSLTNTTELNSSTSAKIAAAEAAKSAGTPEPFQLPQAVQGSEARPVQTRNEATHSIATPVHDPRWAQQLGDRMVWMSRGDIQSAQININPAQLGPIQINISLNGDQMTAHFVAAHQEVRQALDDAMPRLREMLSGAGINLGQANVGSQTPQQQGNGTFAMNSNTPRSGNEDVILSPKDSASTGSRPINQGRGLVDLFA